jgi:Kef-type K+ transport system membrane component KefB
MRTVLRSHFFSAVVGGLVVGAGFALFGAIHGGQTQTVFQEAPIAAAPATTTSTGLTAQTIYARGERSGGRPRAAHVRRMEGWRPSPSSPRSSSAA